MSKYLLQISFMSDMILSWNTLQGRVCMCIFLFDVVPFRCLMLSIASHDMYHHRHHSYGMLQNVCNILFYTNKTFILFYPSPRVFVLLWSVSLFYINTNTSPSKMCSIFEKCKTEEVKQDSAKIQRTIESHFDSNGMAQSIEILKWINCLRSSLYWK